MGENLSVGSVCNIIDHITQLEVASHSHRKHSISTFNKAIVISALASLTAVSTTKKPMNKCNNVIFVFLFSVIAIDLFSLSVSAIILVNAQASSSSDNKGGNGTDKQMGICVIGVRSPCNGDSNSAK
jgi:hypothetical protein